MNDNKKIKTLAKDTGLFAISNFGSKILMFLLTPLYTSILTTEEYGIADLITTTISFIYPILTLAIADATLRFALDKENDKRKVLNNSLLLTFTSIVVLLLFKPAIMLIGQSIGYYWMFFVITYALFNIHNCISNYIKGIGCTGLFAVQGLIQTVVIIVCNILFLVFFKLGLDGYLISIIIGYMVPIAIMIVCGKLYKVFIPFRLDLTLMRDMLSYSIPMVPTLLAWAINISIDKYMIIGYIGLSDSGIYSVAHKIPTIFTTVMSIFTQAWQISAITNYGSDDESRYHTVIYSGLNIISVIGCLFVILLCKWFAAFLFAKEFFIAWRYVPLLTVSAMFASHGGFLASSFRAAKKTKSLFGSVLLGSVLNIGLNWTLIPEYGALGATIATSISFTVIWFVRFVLSQSIVEIKINKATTFFTYLIFFGSAIVTTLDIKCAPLIVVIAILVVGVLNYQDCFLLLRGISTVIKKRGRLR